jgi:hypothetical protein
METSRITLYFMRVSYSGAKMTKFDYIVNIEALPQPTTLAIQQEDSYLRSYRESIYAANLRDSALL